MSTTALDAATLAARLRANGHRVLLDTWTDPKGAAAALGISRRTLRQWRAADVGPAFMQSRRLVLYELEVLARYLAENTHARGA